MDAIKTLKTALTHAKFQDEDIKTATDKLVTKIGDELNAVGYEAGTDVDDAIVEVEDAITAFEQSREGGANANQQKGSDDEDDDELAGFAEDEEEGK